MIQLIILFLLSLLAATISGAAGFGGALFLLPFVINMVGVKAAVPILTIASIFGNASRVWFGRNELKWKPICYFLLAAIPFTILGSYLFIGIDSKVIKIIVGILLILLVTYRRLNINKVAMGNRGMIFGGSLTGFLSGLIGSGGPIGAAFFLGLDLSATAYVASEAFTALALHLSKTIVYNKYSLINNKEIYYALFIGLAMILGSYAGRKIIEKIEREKFILLVEVLLVVTSLQLIYINI